MREAKVITCHKCNKIYLETWDNKKCPHKQIADVIKEGKKLKSGTYGIRQAKKQGHLP